MEFKKVTSTGGHDFVIANGCLVFFSIEVDGSERYFWASTYIAKCDSACIYIKLKTDVKVEQINPRFPHSHQLLCENEIIRQLTALVVQVLVFRESTVRVYFYMHLLSFCFCFYTSFVISYLFYCFIFVFSLLHLINPPIGN